MNKPRVTAAAVLAAHNVLEDHPVPENYYSVSSAEQRRMRLEVVQQALIAAYAADRSASPIVQEGERQAVDIGEQSHE